MTHPVSPTELLDLTGTRPLPGLSQVALLFLVPRGSSSRTQDDYVFRANLILLAMLFLISHLPCLYYESFKFRT